MKLWCTVTVTCVTVSSYCPTLTIDSLYSSANRGNNLHDGSPMPETTRRKNKDTLHTNTLLQLFYGSRDPVQDNPGELVPEETFTHTHLWWSSIIPYLFPPSITIHGIMSVQFTCLTVFFHNLSQSFIWFTATLSLAPSTSYSIHFITYIIVFFLQHMPITSQPVLLQYQDYVIQS